MDKVHITKIIFSIHISCMSRNDICSIHVFFAFYKGLDDKIKIYKMWIGNSSFEFIIL